MLKNFIILFALIGTLWGTPLSFAVQETLVVDTKIAYADLEGDIDDEDDVSDVKPAAPLSDDDPQKVYGLDCKIYTGKGLIDCIVVLSYYVFTGPSGLILFLAGGLFDALLALSISPLLLNQDFVSSSWEIVRNLVNLLFIIIALWIAIATILRVGGIQLKQAVANVIIVALLVNFSFFFTRVVIDASNVIAVEFYNRAGSKTTAASHIPGVPEKRISEKIISSINPQALMSPSAFTKWKDSTKSSNAALIFLFFLIGIINLVVAYVLFYAGFLLLGRVIAFVFLVIASPLAFIAYALPKGGSFASSWWNQLLSQAMVAPVFLFFLYIITKLLSGLGGLIPFSSGSAAKGTSFADLFVTVAIKTAIVIVALMIALNKTKSLSGAAGSYATKAGTAAFGTALGGAALAGRHTIGRAAQGFRDSEAAKRLVARTGVAGEYLDRGLGAMAGGTMDIRGIPGMKSVGLGGPSGKGGYKKSLDADVKRKEELGKRLKGVARMEERREINPETGKYRVDELRGEKPKEGINPATGRTFKYEHEQKIREQEKKDTVTIDVQKEYISRLEESGKKPLAQANRQAAKNLTKKETSVDKIQKIIEDEVQKKVSEKPEVTESETGKPKEA